VLFKAGDFGKPALTHAQQVHGTVEITRLRERITYQYEDSQPGGGCRLSPTIRMRLRLSTHSSTSNRLDRGPPYPGSRCGAAIDVRRLGPREHPGSSSRYCGGRASSVWTRCPRNAILSEPWALLADSSCFWRLVLCFAPTIARNATC
jgi:hypothetical protein